MQLQKAKPPMVVRESGMVSDPVRRQHPLNAPSLMVVTQSGMVSDPVRPLHPQNAYRPMVVTESGIATAARALS